MQELREFEALTPLERALGTPLGVVASRPSLPLVDGDVLGARIALEQVVERAIVAAQGRAAVLFSGGRDSSSVLAVTTAVCRRLGADDPVPVTGVYPNDPASDESEWQQLVIEHLGLRRREIVEITDERRMLSAPVQRSLARWGTVWPVAVHTQYLYLERVPGRVVLTGEGGDGIIEAKRITPLALAREDFPRVSPSLLRAAADALVPTPLVVGKAHRRRRAAQPLPWLRESGQQALRAETDTTRGPLRWDRATRSILSRRAVILSNANSVRAAARSGSALAHPLLDPLFVEAIARERPVWGFRGRTHLFRHLFADLLPDAILSRRTKAAFNTTRWGEDEREFAAGWSGEGVDHDVIDADALREQWLSDRPHPLASFLVHDAWLASAREWESI